LSKLSFAALPALLAALAAFIVSRPQRIEAAGSASPSAIYSHDSLNVTIPYRNAPAGGGKLTIEVLNPENHVLGKTEHAERVEGNGRFEESVKLSQALPMDDLVWHRIRYRFIYSAKGQPEISGIEAMSAILKTPLVHILGQRSYISGAPAAIRIIATDSASDPIASPSSVRIELGEKHQVLYNGPFNGHGTTQAKFRFPAGVQGNTVLHYVVDTPIGSSRIDQQIQLEDKTSILLTTEKPLYQPGQTIHIRALALNRADHTAAANRKITFEVEDPRGNKVFKAATTTDKFGIASTEFPLADEVNFGAYHVSVLMNDPDSANRAEIAVNAEKYVLPKFKVAVELTGQNRHGYRPGDHVTGIVRSNYFFGKSVEGEVTVHATGMDVSEFEAGSVKGRTDSDGAYKFDLALPAYFAGHPLHGGVAQLKLEASVTDSASHTEKRAEPLTVSESPIIITAIPEGGTLAPRLENQVFVVTSYADGKPAAAKLHIHADGNADQNATSDESGVAVIRLRPGNGPMTVDARDKEGNHVESKIALDLRSGQDQILLRGQKAVYQAGDRMRFTLLCTRKQGTAYVDVIKDRQTVLTRDLDIVDGQADLTLDLNEQLAGTLDVNAYIFGANAIPVSDHRLVFVQPADELKISATSDAPVYLPGSEARVRFKVTNSHGQGVSAALGVQAIDEAVYALAEKQPGFAKVFFYLEREVMKPRYQIHSFGFDEITGTTPDQKDRDAQALFSATELLNANRFETESGREIFQLKFAEYMRRYQVQFSHEVQQLAEDLSRYVNGHKDVHDLTKIKADEASKWTRDSWGTPFTLERIGASRSNAYRIVSAGPDKALNTADDMQTFLTLVGPQAFQARLGTRSELQIDIQHDRGPMNGLAQIAGIVQDPSGAFVVNASVTLRENATGEDAKTTSDAHGQFGFQSVRPGEYDITVTSPGFAIASTTLQLAARDLAKLDTTLTAGDVAETVEVTSAAAEVQTNSVMVGMAIGGVPGAQRIRDAQDVLAEHEFAAGAFTIARAGNPQFVTDPRGHTSQVGLLLPGDEYAVSLGSRVAQGPHQRTWFPEALYVNPEIITDKNGEASVTIPIADSITTWRMAMIASTEKGALGTGTASLKVFQDFFADIDLPVTLTQGDCVSIPVAVYNYSGTAGKVNLELQPADWFDLSNDSAAKPVPVGSGKVGGSQFTIQAKHIGKFKLMIKANMPGRADIVVRDIEVIPNGREQTQVFNGRLESNVEHAVVFPASAIPEASKVYVRLYPGPLSQVVEGMDAILRMPYGCFEQTSSTTYPNVLALDYMKRTKKLAPGVHAKAEGFITSGYQRLLTFEVPSGGFSWFGTAPANKILTAYGLMEFTDMAKVHDVDPRLIQRTQQWLASQQLRDGSWAPDQAFINEGATNRYNSDVLRITAYVAWSLASSSSQAGAVERARQYIAGHIDSATDSYTVAVAANFAAAAKDNHLTSRAITKLLDQRTEKDDKAWWSTDVTSVYGTGESAAVETTGLVAQALLTSGQSTTIARKALAYLASQKDASGTWGTTQATIMSLRALLLSADKGGADLTGTVEVKLNGSTVDTVTLTPDNNDLFHEFVLKNVGADAANNIQIHLDGKGSLAYQVVGSYFVPWNASPDHEPLSIKVDYNRSTVSQDDIVTATATIISNLDVSAKMVMVDLGIPPGFDLLGEDLQTLQETTAQQQSGRLQKFTQTATQSILYFDAIPSHGTITVKYRLRAKYPIRARTLASRVYEYYDPAISATAHPTEMEIRRK